MEEVGGVGRAFLKLLQEDAQTPRSHIADQIDVSAPTVNTPMLKLQP
jgi:DNA-binding Lrp family transcriptional regulator